MTVNRPPIVRLAALPNVQDCSSPSRRIAANRPPRCLSIWRVARALERCWATPVPVIDPFPEEARLLES